MVECWEWFRDFIFEKKKKESHRKDQRKFTLFEKMAYCLNLNRAKIDLMTFSITSKILGLTLGCIYAELK